MLAPTPTKPETKIIVGDCLALLKTMLANSVHCVGTSPPYYGLRDYGNPGQIGLEPSPQEYVAKLVEVFREVRRVLRDDGTCWLNLGDSYAGSGKGGNPEHSPHKKQQTNVGSLSVVGNTAREAAKTKFGGEDRTFGMKPKDLIGIPWRVALALQQDGWYLRQDIIWHKPNPMPESVRDRCTKAHEYLFLLTKSDRYYFDSDAIAEESVKGAAGSKFNKGNTATHQLERSSDADRTETGFRNRRSVWTVATKPFKEAHFATFPPALIEPCILAGTSEAGCCSNCKSPYVRQVQRTPMQIDRSDRTHELGRTRSSGTMTAPAPAPAPASTITTGWKPSCQCNTGHSVPAVVLDPFAGACTTGVVAKQHNRHFVGFEINPEYAAMGERRIAQTAS